MKVHKSNHTAEEKLEFKAEFFKSMGHPVRLLILNLIKMKPRHGQELSAILKLNPATVSHHLSRLTKSGLLKSSKDQYYQTYSLVKGPWEKNLGDIVFLPDEGISGKVEEDAYRKKVLKAFFRHGRLERIPSQLKKRLVVLEKILQEFESDREYTEQEVNRILVDFHEDVASLRRGMVANGFMKRSRGIYRRIN